jgi:hypothetical protein
MTEGISGHGPVILFLERCHGPCGQSKSPREMVALGTGGARICWNCFEWHLKALHLLSHGTLPDGCQSCNRSMEVLQAEAKNLFPGGEVRMYVHPKDGLYAVLCWMCSEAYVEANRQLYRDTEYGWEKKLK